MAQTTGSVVEHALSRRDPNGDSGHSLGQEIDLIALYKLDRHQSVPRETTSKVTWREFRPGYRRQGDFLAVMFETRYAWLPTAEAAALPQLQAHYTDDWSGLGRRTDL